MKLVDNILFTEESEQMSTKAQLFTADGQPLYTSGQTAAMMGITRASLITFLHRHEDLHPARRIGQDLFWLESEIDQVRAAKGCAKRGRPAK